MLRPGWSSNRGRSTPQSNTLCRHPMTTMMSLSKYVSTPQLATCQRHCLQHSSSLTTLCKANHPLLPFQLCPASFNLPLQNPMGKRIGGGVLAEFTRSLRIDTFNPCDAYPSHVRAIHRNVRRHVICCNVFNRYFVRLNSFSGEMINHIDKFGLLMVWVSSQAN